MTFSPLISVIIPLYNAERYISQCIESIIYQTYINIEVIIIDDGSTDDSLNICNSFAKQDSRIHIYTQVNSGPSVARNRGVVLSKGDYIIFVDSDDYWLNNEQLNELVKTIHPEDDFIGFNCIYYFPKKDVYRKWVAYNSSLQSKDDIVCNLIKSGTFPMSPCTKIIRKNFLQENNIVFPPNTYCEDIPWFIRLLEMAKQCSFVNLYMYVYRKDMSTSRSSSVSIKSFDDLFYIVKMELKRVYSFNWKASTRKALLSFLAYEFAILVGMVNSLPSSERKSRYNELKKYVWLLHNTLNPKVKLVYYIYRLGGYKNTCLLLNCYLKHLSR